MSVNPIIFSNSPLNRANHLRTDVAWLATAIRAEGSRIIPLWRQKPLLLAPRTDGLRAPAWLAAAGLEALGLAEAPLVFLGLDDNQPHFAVDVGAPDAEMPSPLLAGLGEWVDLRMALPFLSPADAAMLGHAQALLGWHARHGYCGVCGAPTRPADGGTKRVCTGCNAEHFPRTDPVVIMLARLGEKVLLGRQRQFPPGMYSALAGFIEPGETIEEAVAREIFEEAGVPVHNVRYIASQPWPFSSSLMIGCFAEALSDRIRVDGNELEHAAWFTPEEVTQAFERRTGSGPLSVPPPFAIAHQLLRRWIAGA